MKDEKRIIKHDGELSLNEMALRSQSGDWFDNSTGFDNVLPVEEEKQKKKHKAKIYNRWLPLDELENSGAETPEELERVTKRIDMTGESDEKWLNKSRLTEADKARFNKHAGADEPSKSMRYAHSISGVMIAIATLAMIMMSLLVYSVQGGAFIHFTRPYAILALVILFVSIPLVHFLITDGYSRDMKGVMPWVGSVFISSALCVAMYSLLSLFGSQDATEYVPVDTQDADSSHEETSE